MNIKQDILAYAEQKGIVPKTLTDKELKEIGLKKSTTAVYDISDEEPTPVELEPIVEPETGSIGEDTKEPGDTSYVQTPDTKRKTDTKRISDKLCERFAEYGQWKAALVAWAQDGAIRGKPIEMEETIVRLLEIFLSENDTPRKHESEHVLSSDEYRTAMELVPEEIKDALTEFRRIAYFDDVTDSFDKAYNFKFKQEDDAQISALQIRGIANRLEEMDLCPIKELLEDIASKVQNKEYKKHDEYAKDLENAAEIFYRTIHNCSRWMEDEYLSDDTARENYAAVIMRCNAEVITSSFRKALDSGVNGESDNTAKIIDGIAKNLAEMGINAEQLEAIASEVKARNYTKLEFLKQMSKAREEVYTEICRQSTAKAKENSFNKLVADRYKAVAGKFNDLLYGKE